MKTTERAGGRPENKESRREPAGDGGPDPSAKLTLPTQVRATAERQLFGATGEGIVWALVDSGIDSRHPHFQKHQNLVLDSSLAHHNFTENEAAAASSDMSALVDPLGHGTHNAGVIAGELEGSEGLQLRAQFTARSEDGATQRPTAIIPAISGLAPLCKLVSLKVLEDDGSGNLSNVIAALRWVSEVNSEGRKPRIHGVHLGVGFDWDSQWFACGQSPVCVAVNELVKSGVVVVAPAGNAPFDLLTHGGGRIGRAMTIQDPGNAEYAITVGSTNSQDPHTVGISYFSGTGPTWDGRLKPDLVAPGERVFSCDSGVSGIDRAEAGPVRVAQYMEMTGTSMASSYVAGVIAALLSARRDLIGQPMRVKELLLATAEDLKRDRHMQGHGLVNLMRALMESGSAGRLITSGPAERVDQPQTFREGPGVPPASPSPEKREQDFGVKRFAISFSFPGDRRDYVQEIVWELRRSMPRDKIFYDRHFESELAGPNLSARLQRIYENESELVVVFISAEYQSKEWCGLEWRAVQDMIKKRRDEDILPMRFDDTDVPGLFSIDGYIDVRDRDPENVAHIILKRLRANLQKRRSSTSQKPG
jgi:hypothetical protein